MQAGADSVDALLDAAGLPAALRAAPTEHHGGEIPAFTPAELDPDGLRHYVAANAPVVVRQAHPEWRPLSTWDDTHLREACAGRSVSVRSADTDGRFGDPDRESVYARTSLDFGAFLDGLRDAERAGNPPPHYAAQAGTAPPRPLTTSELRCYIIARAT